MKPFYAVLFDTESTFTDKIIHSMSMMALKFSLKDGKWSSDCMVEREIYNSDYFTDIALATKENVVEKLQKTVKKNPSGYIEFQPFSSMMSEFAAFVKRYGGIAIAHSADRDLEFIINSDRHFGSLLFDQGDISNSVKIPKWADINFICSQYLVCNSKWARAYNITWPHADNKLSTLTKEFKKQDHTASGDLENLQFLVDRLCNISNGEFLDYRVNLVFAKPPVGIR